MQWQFVYGWTTQRMISIKGELQFFHSQNLSVTSVYIISNESWTLES